MSIAKNGWNLHLFHARGVDIKWCETRDIARYCAQWYRANSDVTHTAIRKVK